MVELHEPSGTVSCFRGLPRRVERATQKTTPGARFHAGTGVALHYPEFRRSQRTAILGAGNGILEQGATDLRSRAAEAALSLAVSYPPARPRPFVKLSLTKSPNPCWRGM